ncbi:hypothetical protein JRO89_XS03G0015500 [Xanthoceras sorbifolium]|uniref:Retrotransposon gag domain-containing protein n=1 Tax=Xanthoceras sorbifolium TaxID=99658 RepID=A0ABQ8I836_9ROSI|nr:hypothetical protein JRO89_XS03G0015500 [Xanthoceras sorbifolium]
MANNKEKIELLEVGLGGVQNGLRRMELGLIDKIQQLEDTITKLSEALLLSRGSPSNQWWQWLRRTLDKEYKVITWEVFEDELRARFGPSDLEDFDVALSRVKQMGTLRDYQWEFERLGNRLRGWTQKALVGTFMGGLKLEIADEIRMFKPQLLKDVISLARMRDDQLT